MLKVPMCLAPLQELTVSPEGRVAPCCTFKNSPWSISEVLDIEPEMVAEGFPDLHHLLENDSTPLGCKNCFKRESAGLISKRIKLHRRREKRLRDGNAVDLRRVEISFSNICNLDCIMCTSEFSSKLVNVHRFFLDSQDQDLLDFHSLLLKKTVNYTMTETQVIQFAEKLVTVDQIEILGGEPMLFKHLKLFFTTLYELGGRPSEISIVTNGTHIDLDILNLLSKFEGAEIVINLSIDAIGAHYKYIRGIDFQRVAENVKALLELSHISMVFVKPTISIINVGCILELWNWVESFRSEKVQMVVDQFIGDGEPLSLSSLPGELRRFYARQLKESSYYSAYKSEIDEIEKWIESYSPADASSISGARESLKVFDRHRKMKIYEIVPELSFLGDFK